MDQNFAEIILELHNENLNLKLIAVLPYQKRMDSLCRKEHTNALLDACAEIIVIQEEYKSWTKPEMKKWRYRLLYGIIIFNREDQ